MAISARQTALNDANGGFDGFTSGLIPWKVNVMFVTNATVGKLSTRMAVSFAACGAEKSAFDDLKSFARKIAESLT